VSAPVCTCEVIYLKVYSNGFVTVEEVKAAALRKEQRLDSGAQKMG